jgi:hypothetical protein
MAATEDVAVMKDIAGMAAAGVRDEHAVFRIWFMEPCHRQLGGLHNFCL